MAGLLMALPAFAEHTLVLFDENFDRSIPVYGVALCKPEQKSTKKPIRVYFSRYSDAQEEYMPVEVNAKDLTIKKDHMVPVKFENMQEQFYRRYPALYDDFYDYYDSIVSEEFYCKLRGIQDFEFTDNGFLSDNELCEYNKFIQWRIKDMILRYENI